MRLQDVCSGGTFEGVWIDAYIDTYVYIYIYTIGK